MPLMRALWLHYPTDERVHNMSNQYLWGRDLLIAPVFEKGAVTRDVYLPKGDWYDWWTNEKVTGSTTISRPVDLSVMPIYVRAGAIIPFDGVRQYTDEKISEPTTLKIYSGANGDFTLYEDDGISQDYLTGKASLTNITWNDTARLVTLQPEAPDRRILIPAKRTFILQLLPEGITKKVIYAGKQITVQL